MGKQMARTKRVATGLKADLIASATGKGKEPEWSGLVPPTKVQLIRGLNFYNAAKSYKLDDYKTFALAWAKKNRPDKVEAIEAAKPYKFVTYGPLMRMNARGMIFEDSVSARIEDFINSLQVDAPEDEELDEDGNLIIAPPVKKVRKSKANAIAQSFDDALDDAMSNPKAAVAFEVDPSHDPAPVIARCTEALENFTVEGVQQYPKHMKKWFKAALEKLSAVQHVAKVRKPRVVRKRKINPSKMTAKVKYLKSDPALKIDSKMPVDIIGKTKLYLYDTKYKKLTKLVCAQAAGFVIKGTTVMNFDEKKSSVAFIRKPEAELKSGMGIRELDRAMSNTKSKRHADPKGRINEHTLIINFS